MTDYKHINSIPTTLWNCFQKHNFPEFLQTKSADTLYPF